MAIPDRLHPATADRIISRLLPSAPERLRILSALADGIDLAHSLGTRCWALTLGKNYVRLNITRVEAFAIFPDWVRLVVVRTKVPSDFELPDGPDEYKSIANSIILEIQAPDFENYFPRLEQGWRAAIRIPAVSRSPCIYRRSHSPGLVAYVSQVLRRRLPHPRYES